MKFSKKLLVLLLAAMLLLPSVLPITAAAADNAATLTVTPSTVAVQPGETFTLTVSLQNNPGLWSAAFDLKIDTAVFAYVACDTKDAIFDSVGYASYDDSVSTFKLNLYYSDSFNNVTADGKLVTITLRALESASLADYTLTAAVVAQNTRNKDRATVPVADAAARVTVRRLATEITHAQVSLGTDITVNYYATLSTADAGAQMVFTMNEKETVVDAVATAENGLYRFPFEKVAPQCMGDVISARLVLAGETLDTYESFSVRAYCDQVVGMSAAELGIGAAKKTALETLTADLLAYGTAAQSYRGYKTESPANQGFAIEKSAFVPLDADWEYFIDGNATATCALAGAGVYYSNTNALYVMFTADGYTDDNFSLQVKKNGTGEAAVYKLSAMQAPTDANPYYVFVSDAVSALDFDEFYTIALCTTNRFGGSTTVQTLYYGVNYYVYSRQGKTDQGGNPTAMALLAQATYNYGAAAEAYAAAV